MVSASAQVQEQFRAAGVTDVVGPTNIYTGDERLGATLKRAYADATAWVEDNRQHSDHNGDRLDPDEPPSVTE